MKRLLKTRATSHYYTTEHQMCSNSWGHRYSQVFNKINNEQEQNGSDLFQVFIQTSWHVCKNSSKYTEFI